MFQIPDRTKYDPKLPSWLTVYVFLHYLVAFYMATVDVIRLEEGMMGQIKIYTAIFFVFWSLTSTGQLYDGHPLAWKSEFLR